MMTNTDNYPLKGIRAEHFSGPVSESLNEWRTVPELLRAVADWMDARDVKDAEFHSLQLVKRFINEDDEHRETATVYYVEEGG